MNFKSFVYLLVSNCDSAVNFRPEAGSNASRPMSSSKLSANRSTSSSGPSSPQNNIDLSQSDFNPSILMANEAKVYHQKSYPVVYGELVILGFVWKSITPFK